jgi:hypothetical protein
MFPPKGMQVDYQIDATYVSYTSHGFHFGRIMTLFIGTFREIECRRGSSLSWLTSLVIVE